MADKRRLKLLLANMRIVLDSPRGSVIQYDGKGYTAVELRRLLQKKINEEMN